MNNNEHKILKNLIFQMIFSWLIMIENNKIYIEFN